MIFMLFLFFCTNSSKRLKSYSLFRLLISNEFKLSERHETKATTKSLNSRAPWFCVVQHVLDREVRVQISPPPAFKFNVCFLRLRNSVNLGIALLGMDGGGNCKYLKHKRQDLDQKASFGAI